MEKIKVTVWNEEREGEDRWQPVQEMYPQGLHSVIADALNKESDITARAALLSDEEQGLTESVLDNTDVLIWWAHGRHADVEDRFAQRVAEYVQRGMGVIFLHSAHRSKPFMRLLGTDGYLCWRDEGERERLWVSDPSHPIAAGLPESFSLEHEEMYGEPFGIPQPEATVFIGWYEGGNVFRSGVTFRRQCGKIFYFQPGHETNETFYNPHIQRVIANAVRWAKPEIRVPARGCPCVERLEKR
ncbi:MAG: ThuA domain-containing protein [Clostridiales bacterium]|jgi:trehalose utilization protein|nr:ThuA domain-containing protein [Clostridiales bacterium]